MDARLGIDSAVLLLYFVLIISIGLYMGRKEENLKDFALGGRRIPWWAVLASIIAAESNANSLDLRRRHNRDRRSHRHLHDAGRNQSSHLDRFDSSFDHDWQRADCARPALLRDPRRLARNRCAPRRIRRFRFSKHGARSGKNRLGKMERDV